MSRPPAPPRRPSLVAAAAFLVIGVVALVGSAAVASASEVPNHPGGLPLISLNNDTAPAGEPGVDCPDDGVAYWHFVLAPNNGTSSVITVILKLRTGADTTESLNFTGGQLVLNGGQTDNLFVAVPHGHTLGDLIALGSYATYSGSVPNEFDLSHTCAGARATTTTAPVTTVTTAPTVTSAPPEVLGTVQTAPAGATEILGAVQTANELPYTGANTTPILITGLSILAVGGVLAGLAQRRLAGSRDHS